jgi:hypothetical protein
LRGIKSAILSYLQSKKVSLTDVQKESLQDLKVGLSNAKRREDISVRKEPDQAHPISFEMVKHFFKEFPNETVFHRRIRAIVAMVTVSMIRGEGMCQMLNDLKDVYMYSDKALVEKQDQLEEGEIFIKIWKSKSNQFNNFDHFLKMNMN